MNGPSARVMMRDAGAAQFLVVGEGMQMMRGIDLLKLLQRIVLVSHGFGLPFESIRQRPGRIQREAGGE